jgi:hypothetical protein
MKKILSKFLPVVFAFVFLAPTIASAAATFNINATYSITPTISMALLLTGEMVHMFQQLLLHLQQMETLFRLHGQRHIFSLLLEVIPSKLLCITQLLKEMKVEHKQ